MSDKEINHVIESYIKKIAKMLPDSFETEDLLEDLRSHIYESLNEKIQRFPESDKDLLISEVLDELGTPEEIVKEYSIEQVQDETEKDSATKWIYYTMRLMTVILVIVLASWVVSILTEGAVDFMLAVVVLLFFAVLESYIRTHQTKDA